MICYYILAAVDSIDRCGFNINPLFYAQVISKNPDTLVIKRASMYFYIDRLFEYAKI